METLIINGVRYLDADSVMHLMNEKDHLIKSLREQNALLLLNHMNERDEETERRWGNILKMGGRYTKNISTNRIKNSIMKTTLSIDASKVRELYNAGCGAVKIILEESFGKDFFKGDITDRVKTYEDALNVLGVEDFLTVRTGSTCTFGKLLSSHMVAYIKLCAIIEALNEGWKPNWNDSNECKYYPYFVMSPSSFAFRDSYCGSPDAPAGSGSLLCLKSKELSDYCGKQFIDLWRDVQLG